MIDTLHDQAVKLLELHEKYMQSSSAAEGTPVGEAYEQAAWTTSPALAAALLRLEEALKEDGDPDEYPHCQAAFVNALAEEGRRKELVQYLQKGWDEICFLRKKLRAALRSLGEPAA